MSIQISHLVLLSQLPPTLHITTKKGLKPKLPSWQVEKKNMKSVLEKTLKTPKVLLLIFTLQKPPLPLPTSWGHSVTNKDLGNFTGSQVLPLYAVPRSNENMGAFAEILG